MADNTVPGMREAIEARMTSEGLSPTALEAKAQLSNPMCVEVRAGTRKNYAFKTRIGFARALRWPADWYDRLVAGDDAAGFPDTDWPIGLSLEERVAALESRLDALVELVEQSEP